MAVWCRKLNCIHNNDDRVSCDAEGRYGGCMLEETTVSKDLKCEEYMEVENERL